MEFIKTEGTAELVTSLIAALNTALAEQKPVLWLVPGGSNINVAVKVMADLDTQNLDHLTIVLTDERFGPPGHPDSNFFQLHQAGFAERGAAFVDLLYGGDFEETVRVSSDAMGHLFGNASTIIALMGVGPDGHVAGILPHSPAAVSDETWMIGYDGGQYQRITLTPFALSHVGQAFVGAFGAEKRPALLTLHDQVSPITDQPAQLLRQLPSVKIYNDQIEGVV